MEKSETISRVIKKVSEAVTTRINLLRELLNKIAKEAKGFLNCDACTIWFYDEDKKQLILRGASGKPEKGIGEYFYRKNEGLHWHMFEHEETFKLRKASDAKGIWKGKYVSKIYSNGDRNDTGGPFLGVPIIFRGRSIGAISFAADDLNYEFKPKDLEFAQIIANEIALALDDIDIKIENQRLTSLRTERLIFLSNFSRGLMGCKLLEEIYKLTTETTMKRLNCRTASIFLFSKHGKLVRKYIAGLENFEPTLEIYERGLSFTGKTAGTPSLIGKPHISNDFKKEPYIRNPKVKAYVKNYETKIKEKYGFDEEIKHVVTIPLNGANRTFGVLRIINKLNATREKLSEEGITKTDKEWLILIANIVATAVANIKKQIKSDSINKINELLSEKKEEEIFDSLADIITEKTTCFSACIIRTLDEKRDHLIVSGVSGVSVDREKFKIKIDEGVAGRTLLSVEPVVISNIYENPEGHARVEWAKRNKLVSMICLPLRNVKNTLFGTISIYTKYEYIFDPSDIEYFTNFAKQVSNVVQIIQEKRDLKVINKILTQINRKSDIKGILGTAVSEIPGITGFDVCGIVKRENDCYCVIASSHQGVINSKISSSNPIVLEMREKPRIIVYHDVDKDPDNKFEEVRKILKNIKSLVLIPIITAHEKLYGTIALASLSKEGSQIEIDPNRKVLSNIITQLNENLYKTLANQIAIAVNRQRLLESLRIERDRKEITNEIIRQISSDEDLDNNLKTTLDEIIKLLHADIGYISLLSKISNYVHPTYFYGIKLENFPTLKVGGKSITGWVYNNKEAYLWPSGKEIDDWNVPYVYLEEDVKTEIIAPLIYGNEVIGFMTVASKEEGIFKEPERLFLESVAKQIAVIIQNKRFHLSTEKLSEIHFDEKDVHRNCEILAEKANQILENYITCVWLKKIKGGKICLSLESWSGVDMKRNIDYYDMPKGEGGVSWETVKKKNVLFITDNLGDPKHKFKHPEFIKENELESMISVPLIVFNDVIGVINSYSRRTYKFFDKEVYLLKGLASRGAIAIKSAELTRKMEDINAKILDSAQLANPGHVAMSFTHDAKHTMHNINAQISSLIYSIPEYVRKQESVKYVIESVTKDTDYLRELFNSMVRYAKKAENVDYKLTKLRDIIEYISDIYQIRLKKDKIKYDIKYEEEELKELQIECDRSQIEQVFLNLFNNSVYAIGKKMSKGGIIDIFIRSLDDKYIEIQFKDNGMGISPKDIDYVFEPFFTTKEDNGGGFGLVMCKRIVEDNHSGTIDVKSKFLEYTTFFIKLEKIK
jgi:GAF domain-containing protein